MQSQSGRMTLAIVTQHDSVIRFFAPDDSSDYEEEYLYLLNPVPDRPRSVYIGIGSITK